MNILAGGPDTGTDYLILVLKSAEEVVPEVREIFETLVRIPVMTREILKLPRTEAISFLLYAITRIIKVFSENRNRYHVARGVIDDVTKTRICFSIVYLLLGRPSVYEALREKGVAAEVYFTEGSLPAPEAFRVDETV